MYHSFIFFLLADYALGRNLQAEGHASNQEQRRAHPVDETRRADDTHSRAGQIPRQTKKVYTLLSQHSYILTTDDDIKSLCLSSRTGINEIQNLKYLPRSTMERELLIEDRTPAHADHVGFGPERQTTAAVGKC